MNYEEYYFSKVTDEELETAIRSELLDGYIARCKTELARRKEAKKEIINL